MKGTHARTVRVIASTTTAACTTVSITARVTCYARYAVLRDSFSTVKHLENCTFTASWPVVSRSSHFAPASRRVRVTNCVLHLTPFEAPPSCGVHHSPEPRVRDEPPRAIAAGLTSRDDPGDANHATARPADQQTYALLCQRHTYGRYM